MSRLLTTAAVIASMLLPTVANADAINEMSTTVLATAMVRHETDCPGPRDDTFTTARDKLMYLPEGVDAPDAVAIDKTNADIDAVIVKDGRDRYCRALSDYIAVTAVGDLTSQIHTYVPIVAISIPCNLELTSAHAKRHASMRKEAEQNPEALKLISRLHWSTQAQYREASKDGGKREWCNEMLESNSGVAKWHTTLAEVLVTGANKNVRAAVVHDVCGQGQPVKLSPADRASYNNIRSVLRDQIKVRKAVDGGFAEEITVRFCKAAGP